MTSSFPAAGFFGVPVTGVFIDRLLARYGRAAALSLASAASDSRRLYRWARSLVVSTIATPIFVRPQTAQGDSVLPRSLRQQAAAWPFVARARAAGGRAAPSPPRARSRRVQSCWPAPRH